MLARIIGEQGWRAPITVSRRSGFINEAVNRYLVELGLVEPESNTEVTPK